MAKLQLSDVKEARKVNLPNVYNQAAALTALKATPLKSSNRGGCGVSGDLSKNIKSCLETAKENGILQISPKQVTEMISAMSTFPSEPDAAKKAKSDLGHSISSMMWNWSDVKTGGNANPLLKQVSKGVYEII